MPEPDYSTRGPHPVGLLQTQIASPQDPIDAKRTLPCDVWYPAVSEAREDDSAPHPLRQRHRATLGLPALDTPRPIIGFSHGNAGLRQQSTFLTTHLASWGFVVIAPDHVGNTFSEMMALEDDDARKATHLRLRRQRPTDLSRVLGALVDDGVDADARPAVDPNAIGVLGHSFGGWTALKATRLEPRVRAACCLAPASEPFVGRKAFDPGELPLRDDVASLVIAAEDDVLVDLETSVHPLFERLGPGAGLEVLDRADHFHFCDGVGLLHDLHVKTPRKGLPRPPRPLAELRDEGNTHAWLQERVTRFFVDALMGHVADRAPNPGRP